MGQWGCREALVDFWPVHIILALCPSTVASPGCSHVYTENSSSLSSDLGSKAQLRFSVTTKFLFRAQIQEQVTSLEAQALLHQNSLNFGKKKSPLTKSQIHSHIPNLLAKGITDFFLPIPSFCLWRGVEESAFVVVLVCKLLTKLNNSPPKWPTKYLACLLMTSLRWHKTKAIISSLESLDCYFWTIIWFGVFILIWRQLRIFCDSVEHLEELILLLHVFK